MRGKSTQVMDNELRHRLVSLAKGGSRPGQVYLESDYWYHKGVVLNTLTKNSSQKASVQLNEDALECYK